jgi:hypothetical protein
LIRSAGQWSSRGDGDVFRDGQVGEQADALEDIANAAAKLTDQRPDIVAIDLDPPEVG